MDLLRTFEAQHLKVKLNSGSAPTNKTGREIYRLLRIIMLEVIEYYHLTVAISIVLYLKIIRSYLE